MLPLLVDVAKRCPGGKLPESYLIVDTETSGLDKANDYILQVGMCLVENRKIQTTIAQIINRPGVLIHPKALAIICITPERMEKEGVPVDAYMPWVLDFIRSMQKTRKMFLGHNILAFDIPLFQKEAERFGQQLPFGSDEMIDTGALVKAAQLNLSMGPNESLMDFWKRVTSIRARGVFWSLANHCHTAYNLGKYGVDITKAHDAGVDCQLVHFLMEELRLMTVMNRTR